MIPFLHLGPLTIPTYGLMVATGLLVAAYILQADFDRRRGLLKPAGGSKKSGAEAPRDEGFLVIGVAGLAGLIGSRIYSVLESPSELFANPSLLISRFGFTWFGGLLGGFFTLIFLARHFKIPLLLFLDMCSPAAAVGYAFGRMGCLLSGDGDYGRPTTWHWPWGIALPNGIVPTTQTCVEWGWPTNCRVYPTPVYEFLIWVAIGAFLWHLGKKAVSGSMAVGVIFSNYLILTGIARFLIEFIRINPKVLYGMSNAQVVSLVSIVIGIVLLWRGQSATPIGSQAA
jgi:phosphatidylglycerol---prolipoprotein diacylglyceryl transferase